MNKYFLIIASLLVISGCEKSTNSVVCDKYTVEFQESGDADTLNIVINGDAATLSHVVSASGARYSGVLNDTNIELWNKGHDWTLFLNDDTPILCK